MFEEKREAVLAIEVAVMRLMAYIFGRFGVFRSPL
jgi:hypothetical protein